MLHLDGNNLLERSDASCWSSRGVIIIGLGTLTVPDSEKLLSAHRRERVTQTQPSLHSGQYLPDQRYGHLVQVCCSHLPLPKVEPILS